MFNPPDSQKDFGPVPYWDLRQRILQQLQTAKIDDQILAVVQQAYAKALADNNLLLSRTENKRLLAQVLKAVLDEMSKKLVGAPK